MDSSDLWALVIKTSAGGLREHPSLRGQQWSWTLARRLYWHWDGRWSLMRTKNWRRAYMYTVSAVLSMSKVQEP